MAQEYPTLLQWPMGQIKAFLLYCYLTKINVPRIRDKNVVNSVHELFHGTLQRGQVGYVAQIQHESRGTIRLQRSWLYCFYGINVSLDVWFLVGVLWRLGSRFEIGCIRS